ncbi:transposon Ty3-G Gag-Pol polyprotein [Trichonephila clavipes]|nr:transposon Ty3-G Gag-Pol polyprotein [Trichonephila clavipes]
MTQRTEYFNVDDKLMMELFLQRLPSSVQTILAALSDLTLNKVADIADRILDVSPSPIESFAVSNKKEQTLESKQFREVEKLNERNDRLSICRGRSPYRRNKNSHERNIIPHKLSKESPSITKLPNPNQPVKHITSHHKITKGPPVMSKPRRVVGYLKQNSNKCSPPQLRNLDLISQYSTDIRHVQVSENTVADTPSRIEIDSNTKSPVLNFKEFSLAQKNVPDLKKYLQTDGSSLKLELKPYQTPDCNLLCDISTGFQVLSSLHRFEEHYLIIFIIFHIQE